MAAGNENASRSVGPQLVWGEEERGLQRLQNRLLG